MVLSLPADSTVVGPQETGQCLMMARPRGGPANRQSMAPNPAATGGGGGSHETALRLCHRRRLRRYSPRLCQRRKWFRKLQRLGQFKRLRQHERKRQHLGRWHRQWARGGQWLTYRRWQRIRNRHRFGQRIRVRHGNWNWWHGNRRWLGQRHWHQHRDRQWRWRSLKSLSICRTHRLVHHLRPTTIRSSTSYQRISLFVIRAAALVCEAAAFLRGFRFRHAPIPRDHPPAPECIISNYRYPSKYLVTSSSTGASQRKGHASAIATPAWPLDL